MANAQIEFSLTLIEEVENISAEGVRTVTNEEFTTISRRMTQASAVLQKMTELQHQIGAMVLELFVCNCFFYF